MVINHISRKLAPVFEHPHHKEIVSNVWFEPSLLQL